MRRWPVSKAAPLSLVWVAARRSSTAKASSCYGDQRRRLWDYVFGGSGKGQKIPNPALPIVAVTTTAGTGTEADPWTVITNGEEKIGGGGDKTFSHPVDRRPGLYDDRASRT